ncbi:M24 family metallopeptidase [candidate division KSB1 bacterium]|nr:M24 family metallopeptidase [candidate division KSB1 bacterium]
MQIDKIQSALQKARLDGWLFYDFRDRDPIAQRILEMDPTRHTTRRWYYFIPARGEAQKVVHRIEPWKCDHLPGTKHVYLAWQEQHALLRKALGSAKTIAMQYSPKNAIPYVSTVDGGTLELIRSFGIEVVSSADLVGQFEAHLSESDWQTHRQAGESIQKIKDQTFAEVAHRIRAGHSPTEIEIQHFMQNLLQESGLEWDSGPIVAVNEHAADPHYEPTPELAASMKRGDLLLIDVWAKLRQPRSIYYDITWMGYIGETVPNDLELIFGVIRSARDAAVELVRERFAAGTPVYGWEVDEACRRIVVDAGYGDAFTHRTGHNIGEQVHGNGVHIDNLETKDERRILPGTCFSVEPGIYLPDQKIGFRTEIDVFVTEEGTIEITGAVQQKIIPLLA